MRYILLCTVIFLTGYDVFAQTPLSPHSLNRNWYERMVILYGGDQNEHLSIRDLHRSHLFGEAIYQIEKDTSLIAEWLPVLQEEDDFRAFTNEKYRSLSKKVPRSERKDLWNTFYTNPHYIYAYNGPDFYLRGDLLLHLSGSPQFGRLFSNQRGARIRGGIDQKVFFEADVLESQQKFPNYVDQFTRQFGAIPGNGFFKSYNSSLLGIEGGRDYNNSSGRINWNFTPHISATVGYDQNFIGDGFRSLILSDFSNNYFFGRLDTRVWKLHYTNIWGNLSTGSHRDIPGDRLIPNKWFAHHYLSVNLSPQFRLGLFETVVFGRENGRFDINYLIPLIFYRSVEGSLGSPDNVLLGLDFRWDLFNHMSLYGQLVLDEFKASELLVERRGWWANKYAYQLGLKYFDALGVKGLQAQLEANIVRPFTYGHSDSLSNFTHYNMPMAHPLGANFEEYLFLLQYDTRSKWRFEMAMFFITQGRSEEENVGWDITTSNLTRSRDFGFELLEGTIHRIYNFRAQTTYEIYPDLDVFLRILLRHSQAEGQPYSSDLYIRLGVAYNLQLPSYDF